MMRYSRSNLLWLIIRRDKAAATGIILIMMLLSIATVGPWLAPQNPTHQELVARLAPPSWHHLLGTDEFGRDLLSRILAGARYTLTAAVFAVFWGLIWGTPLGLAMGYFGGRVDRIATRFVDALLGFPYLLLAIVVVGALGPSLRNAALAVGITSVPIYARVARAETLRLRHLEYVTAAVATGGSSWYTIRHHILPGALGSLIVIATIGVANAVYGVAGLSFLGLGAQPPTPEWGAMLTSGRSYLLTDPYAAMVPGLALVVAMLAFNLVGDALRDAMDPRMR